MMLKAWLVLGSSNLYGRRYMMSVEIPSFSKSKLSRQFHSISDGFAALEKIGVLVTEMRLNSTDFGILKADPDFDGQSVMLDDGGIAVWSAKIIVDDDMECVRLSGNMA
jgi:hypothetical protein